MSECRIATGAFDYVPATVENELLRVRDIDTVQVNLGFLCNRQYKHCHAGMSPYPMDWTT